MLLKVHPENPSQRQILKVCEVLQRGGVIVYPTDSVYAFGCDIYNSRAVERIARLKGIRLEHADFSKNNIPRIFHSRKKTIGIRIPGNNIPLEIVRELGHPIMTTSIHDEDMLIEYTTDPDLIWEKFKDQVDAVVNGGYGHNVPSTVIDCTNEEPVLLRQGIGPVN
jgi:tRNA A37 threonylcarbamoyladenosine synthetase subunit TsaC/SUA5/YrdC